MLSFEINKQHIFWQILRLMPILIVFYCVVNFIINPSETSLLLLIINIIVKTIIIYDNIHKFKT